MTFASQLSAAFTPIAAVYDAASVTQALAWAQTFIEDYCNRGEGGFDLTTGDTAFCDPKPYRKAFLPHFPVVNINSVQALLPSPEPNGGMAWTSLTNYRCDNEIGMIYDTTGEAGTPMSFGWSWPWLPASLQVNYDWGFPTVPTGLVNAAVRFAQQYLENPTLLLQRGVGDVNDRFAGNTGGVGIVINEFDKRILDRYTLVSIG